MIRRLYAHTVLNLIECMNFDFENKCYFLVEVINCSIYKHYGNPWKAKFRMLNWIICSIRITTVYVDSAMMMTITCTNHILAQGTWAFALSHCNILVKVVVCYIRIYYWKSQNASLLDLVFYIILLYLHVGYFPQFNKGYCPF